MSETFIYNGFNIGLGISILIGVLPYFVIYSLKPKLKIDSICVCNRTIKIKVLNIGKFDAFNLRIEVCAYDAKEKQTFHFKLDQSDFLILPSKRRNSDNSKIFNTVGISSSAEPFIEGNTQEEKLDRLIRYINNGFKVRVRIHAYHSFSGLGKSFEKYN